MAWVLFYFHIESGKSNFPRSPLLTLVTDPKSIHPLITSVTCLWGSDTAARNTGFQAGYDKALQSEHRDKQFGFDFAFDELHHRSCQEALSLTQKARQSD